MKRCERQLESRSARRAIEAAHGSLIVRFQGQSGQHSLVLSFSVFDPKWTSSRRREYGMIRAYALRGRPI
jgi:hypothetical protein